MKEYEIVKSLENLKIERLHVLTTGIDTSTKSIVRRAADLLKQLGAIKRQQRIEKTEEAAVKKSEHETNMRSLSEAIQNLGQTALAKLFPGTVFGHIYQKFVLLLKQQRVKLSWKDDEDVIDCNAEEKDYRFIMVASSFTKKRESRGTTKIDIEKQSNGTFLLRHVYHDPWNTLRDSEVLFSLEENVDDFLRSIVVQKAVAEEIDSSPNENIRSVEYTPERIFLDMFASFKVSILRW